MDIFKRLHNWSDSRGIAQQKVAQANWAMVEYELADTYDVLKDDLDVSGYVLNKMEELIEYTQAMRKGDENEVVDAIADSSVFDATELTKMGYDIELTMNEVLMVVESRKGQWDDGLGKFMKDKSPEAIEKWYEPNYIKNCKLKSPKSYIASLFNA